MANARVCLSMIVKDESPVIERCLNAIRGRITSWVVVDTGSSDDTMEKVRRCLDGIPGEIHEAPFEGFSVTRTKALELARQREDSDFTLLVDADDTWIFDEGFRWPHPNRGKAGFEVKLRLGTTAFWRPCLVRTELPWSYRGVAHEYLACKGNPPLHRLRGAHIRCGNDGHRRTTEPVEKYRRVARQLENDLKRKRAPRTLFYAAQAHQDAGEKARALELYDERATVKPHNEEWWCAMYRGADLAWELKYPRHEIIRRYLDAYVARPQRAEPLYSLALYLRRRKEYALASVYAAAALDVPRPEQDTTFVEEDVYDWRSLDEYATTSTWLPGRKCKAIAAMRNTLAVRGLPANERKRVQKNLAECSPRLGNAVKYGEAVTVTISAYKSDPDRLRRAVASVLNQTYENLHLVVVSDGDPDAPWDAIADYRSDARLTTFTVPENRGQFFAHDLVLRATSDRMFAVQDDDDESHPERIERLVRKMAGEKADVVFAPVKRVNPDGSVYTQLPSWHLLEEWPLEEWLHIGSHVGLFQTRALRRVGGYYGGFRLGVDTLIGLMVSRLGTPAFIVEKPALYVYHRRNDSQTTRGGTGFGSNRRQAAIEALQAIWAKVCRTDHPHLTAQRLMGERVPHAHADELDVLVRDLKLAMRADDDT